MSSLTTGAAASAATVPTVAPRLSTVRSLRRLVPYARPAAPAMAASMLAAGVATGCGLAFPLVIGAIIDGPITHRDTSHLIWWGALLLALGIGEAGLFFVRRIIIARPAMLVEARMRQDLYEKLQRLPVAFHDRWPAGQLLSRAISDLGTIRRFVSFAFIFLIVNIMTFAIGATLLIVLSWQLGLVVAALAIPLVLLAVIFEFKYRSLSRRAQDQVGDLATMVEESVLGIRILKAFGQSGHFSRQFLRQAGALRDTELTKARVLSWLWSAMVALPEIALGIALLMGVKQVANGDMSAGMLVAFFGVAMTLRWPVDSIGWLLAISNETAAASERFFEVMDSTEAISSPADSAVSQSASLMQAGSEQGPSGRGPASNGKAGHLAFRDVYFAFDDDPDSPVLRGLSLTLEPGETVALVGRVGSGKTTFTSLVNRLHDVTGGSIELGGVDIRNLGLAELRRRVAVAFEEPILFSASVRENVAIGLGSDPTATARYDVSRRNGTPGLDAPSDDAVTVVADGAISADDAVDAAVARAIRVAQAEFVYDLPHGLATRIGEQGLSLSGGQRQRLALARAIVSRPEVLVLDDPLSALDIHTEAAVEQALASVLADTTALVVAHRASTVLLADRVALLEDGRITTIGTHSMLMATVPAYRDLLSSSEYTGTSSTRSGGNPTGPRLEG
ncbi:MAG: ABC transporter ATP-binding protein [Nakamurella sp.]